MYKIIDLSKTDDVFFNLIIKDNWVYSTYTFYNRNEIDEFINKLWFIEKDKILYIIDKF